MTVPPHWASIALYAVPKSAVLVPVTCTPLQHPVYQYVVGTGAAVVVVVGATVVVVVGATVVVVVTGATVVVVVTTTKNGKYGKNGGAKNGKYGKNGGATVVVVVGAGVVVVVVISDEINIPILLGLRNKGLIVFPI